MLMMILVMTISYLPLTINAKALSMLPGKAALTLDHHTVPLRMVADTVHQLSL